MKDAEAEEKVEATKKEKEKEEDAPTPIPPLQAAAYRLERLLGGGLDSSKSNNKSRSVTDVYYSNPVKVVRRWMGTSSGAAAAATAEDIKAAAIQLLDPTVEGCKLLVPTGETASSKMQLESEEESMPILVEASREIECWLLTLAVRVLWRETKITEAFELCQQAIQVLLRHLEKQKLRSSLYPILARLFRWRSMLAETIGEPSLLASLRGDMAKAQNMASVRRDVETQSTLMNCMLRDLLKNSQSMYTVCYLLRERITIYSMSSWFLLASQSNKLKSFFPTHPFPKLPRTISSVGTCTTVDASKPCAWNTTRHFQT